MVDVVVPVAAGKWQEWRSKQGAEEAVAVAVAVVDVVMGVLIFP